MSGGLPRSRDLVGVRVGNDPVDTVAPPEFEAVYQAVAEHLMALDADA